MRNIVSLATAVAVAVGLSFSVASVPDVQAAPINVVDATENPATTPDFIVDPDNYSESAWWDPSISPQSPANAEANLEAEFGLELDYLDISGACGTGAVTCDEEDNKSGSIDLGSLTASVFGVHFDNQYLAFVYDTAISVFSIEGLSHGVSNIHAFTTDTNVVPLPAGLLLFLTGLAGVGVLGRYKAKRQAPAIV